ncbi:MAG: SPL family radical SAM protein [Faecousia sp.]
MHYVKAKGILSSDNGMNLYRGCLHGCIYCDSRSLCYQMDHVFEDIEVKENALELLEQALKRKRKRCMIGTGAMTDPYLPLEEKLLLTRGALELIRRYGFGVTVLTKSDAIVRDLDLLADINRQAKAVVQMTLTTYDDQLCRILEPNVSDTSQRVAALKVFRDAGVPTIVWLDPILPFLNDTKENINGILNACTEAGVKGVLCFNMGLTLRSGNREYFYAQLDRHFPGLKERYIRTYGNQYEINSPRNRELMALFHERCEQSGMLHDVSAIFRYLHAFPETDQEDQISFLPGSM